MKFLLKLEEVLDRLILTMVAKTRAQVPQFIFSFLHWLRSLPSLLKQKCQAGQAKMRIFFLKLVGYTSHYFTMLTGHLVGFFIYLRSEEFKQKDKVEIFIAPLNKLKTDPFKALSVSALVIFFGASSYLIFKNTATIVLGTKALRTPASAIDDQEPLLEFRKLKYPITLPTGTNTEIGLDVSILALSHEELEPLLKQEEKILEMLEKFSPKVMELPLTLEDKAKIEEAMLGALSTGLNMHGIKSLQVKQVLDARPKYFMQTEKLCSFKDTNLQLFLEDTKRNRQIWVDFTALTSNRHVVLYLKDKLVEIRDHLNINVEPIIPRLPLEDEGRQIIREKIKLELNEFLKKEGVEGKVLEVYIDYLIVS